MKYTTSVLLATAGWASALTQQCLTGTPKDEGGNYFCGAVDQIIYQGIKGAGKFKAVTDMGPSGQCEYEERPYSGPLAPLDEGLSIHIRGPISVKQVAVYNLASSKSKRDVQAESEPEPEEKTKSSRSAHNHGHQHLHRRAHGQKRDRVFATINGQEVSWENNWFGPPADKPAASPPPAQPAAQPPAAQPAAQPPAAQPAAQPPASKPAGAALLSDNSDKPDEKSTFKAAPSGLGWDRVAYYNAEEQVAENMVFMGNYGGAGSGVFDTTWGASVSYLNAKGDGGASSPQILSDVLIPSSKEFAIFSAEKCDDSCGYSRAKDVAYKGFGGANKVFLFHFKMPLDGVRSFEGDMPAIWALNARIPRTAQYSECSCWMTGCGEVDIFEVLTPGDTKCKSTFHLANGAGSSDYFDRPVDKYVKVAAVFNEATASVAIKKLDDDVDFSKGLDDATVSKWLSQPTDSKDLKLSSLFQVMDK